MRIGTSKVTRHYLGNTRLWLDFMWIYHAEDIPKTRKISVMN